MNEESKGGGCGYRGEGGKKGEIEKRRRRERKTHFRLHRELNFDVVQKFDSRSPCQKHKRTGRFHRTLPCSSLSFG